MTIAQEMARFIVNADINDFPEETIEFTKQLSFKCIGGMLVGSTVPSSRKILQFVKENSDAPEAGIIGCGLRSSVENAALANGYFAHSSELEDDQFPGGGVSDITVWPTVLTLAEHLKLTGSEVIETLLIGEEVQNRIGYYVSHLTESMGIVGLPFFGIFGSTAAACRAYRLSEEQTAQALGIAISQGIGYIHNFGTDAHFLESAFDCRNGITIAKMARDGMTSNPSFEKWLNTFVGEGKIDYSKITENLGKPPFFIHNVWFKKYPGCFFTHRYIDALGLLQQEHHLSYDQIEEVAIDVGPTDAICDRPQPQTLEDAMFSFQHQLSAVMLEGEINKHTFTDQRLFSPAFTKARSKIKVRYPENWPNRYMANAARVEVLLKNGTRLEKELEQSIGGPQNPLTMEQCVALYRKLAADALSEKQIEKTVSLLSRLEQLPDILELMDIMTFRHRVISD